jgi:hypothetical protein
VWLNLGGHVFAGTGSASDRLISAAGVHAVPVPGRLAAVELGGRVVASGRPETFPLRLPLPLTSRVALVRAGARVCASRSRYAARASRGRLSRNGERCAHRRSVLGAHRSHGQDVACGGELVAVQPSGERVRVRPGDRLSGAGRAACSRRRHS